jgi:quercetin dioxygenase-like cupin family protein
MNDLDPAHPATHAFDAMIKAPGHHFVLLENGRTRVLDTRLEPGQRTPVHAHEWPAALYVLSWSDFVRYDPQGKVLLDSRALASRPPAGSALWGEPIGPHYVENVGTEVLHILAVEIKD